MKFLITTIYNFLTSIISSIIKYWKLIILMLLGFYIVYLNISLNSKENTILQLKANYQKERDALIIRMREQEAKYKSLETKYNIDVLRKKLDNKSKINQEINTIKTEDASKVLKFNSTCSECLKRRYNEKTVIIHSI